MADNNTTIAVGDAESAEEAPVQKLPNELILKIFQACLEAAEPVDYLNNRSTYLRALAPFNVNRAMRAEAPKQAVRHLRFIVDREIPVPFARPEAPITKLPFPLAALRHIELRVSAVPLNRTPGAGVRPLNTIELLMLQGIPMRLIEPVFDLERMPQLRTIVYALDCHTSPDQLLAWKVQPNYGAIVCVVGHILTSSPAHVTATVKLDTNGHSRIDPDMFPAPGDRVTGLARKIIMSPDVEFEVERKVVDAVSGSETN